MSYKINFYTLSKRHNSTLQPTGKGAEMTCELMSRESILRPVFTVQDPTPFVYNYAYIPVFSRYYWINDCRWDNGLWVLSMSVDVLASWKSAIGSYSGYVLRSAYASNGNIKDTFYPAKTNPSHSVKIINLNWQDELSNGRYVVGVISGSNSNAGSVSYYVMTPIQFNAFCDAIYANTGDWLNSANINDISTDLLKTLFNPFEYVVSAMWFPFTVPTDGVTVNNIPLGWWSIPVSGARLYSEAVVFFDYTFTPDPHPQAATRGAYLNSAPFTTLTLDFQPFGMIPLDASIVCGQSLTLNVYVDYISGTACLHITQNSGQTILYSAATQIGVPIQISGRQPNIASFLAGSIASNFNTGLLSDINKVMGDMTSAFFGERSQMGGKLSSIANAASQGLQRLMSNGSNGSRAQILPEAYLAQDYMLLADENIAEFGRPLYETRQISTIPGYIQMGENDISFAGLEPEITEVRGYLQTGFFYE